MQVQSSKIKVQSIKVVLLMLLSFFTFSVSPVFSEQKWQGVDESVVEKYAKENGREAGKPLINTDRGDMLLFVFLLAGSVAGFAAGYYWRELTEPKQKERH